MHPPYDEPGNPPLGRPGGTGSGPLVIGLVGGVGSGKSTVAGLFQELGCAVLDADRLSHVALKDTRIRDRVVAEFGPQILDFQGVIDRSRLRAVFRDPSALARLESILHPEVLHRIHVGIQEARDRGLPGVVIDAPLLLETGLDRLCDVVVLVDVPEEVRRARAETRGMEAADWTLREKRQKSIAAKRARADHSLDNRASLPEIRRRVEALWRLFLAGRKD